MSTFKELQDDVLDICQELQGKPDFTLTRVKRMINRGYYEFAKKTRCLMSEHTISTVADQETYAIDDEILDFSQVRYITDSSSEFGKKLHRYPGGYTALPKLKSSGEPDYYYIRGIETLGKSEIGFYPVPDAVQTIKGWVYVLPGGETAAELSANGDEPKFRDGWQDALVYYAVYRLFSIYGHDKPQWNNKAGSYLNLFLEQVEDFKMNSTFEGGDFYTVVDVDDSYWNY